MKMNDIISKLKTPKECEQLASNVAQRSPDLAKAARRRAVELRADSHGAKSEVEREALQAVYAYERTLFQKHGKNIRASRTWQMIDRHGILGAVERAVNRPTETAGYTALVELGMSDFAFEAVVCRHPEMFSVEAVEKSKERMKNWGSETNSG